MPLGQIVFKKILDDYGIVVITFEILTLVLNGKVSSRMRCLLLNCLSDKRKRKKISCLFKTKNQRLGE